MRSFLDYYLDRENNVLEMAVPAARFGQESVHEKRKAPIFLDEADIEFLYQFPPFLWSQALSYRYGELLYQTEKLKENNLRPKDVQNVVLNYKGPILFPNVKTGAQQLHRRVTADVDDDLLSTLSKSEEDKEFYKNQAAEKKLGYMGFDLGHFKKSKKYNKLGAAKGFIMVHPKTASTRLATLRDAIREGWYGEPPKDEIKKVKFAGASSDAWVHNPEELEQLPDSDKFPSTNGMRIWVGYRKDGKKVTFTSYLPKLFPSKMVDSHLFRQHNLLKNSAEQIEQDVQTEDFELYRQAAHPNHKDALFRQVEELKKWLQENKRPTKGRDPLATERRRKYKDLRKIKNALLATEIIAWRLKNEDRDPSEMQNDDVLRDYLLKVSDHFHDEAVNIRQNADRYDQHDWNVHHFNTSLKRNLHTSATGFGTINVNWQQKETVHGALLKLGINPEEFWEELEPYLVQSNVVDDIPYTRQPGTKKDVAYGHLAEGINAYLGRGDIHGTPAWHAMTKHWWDIFNNAATYMRGFIGSRNFLPFARQYEKFKSGEFTPEIKGAFRQMEKASREHGYNYAGMVYQLKSRMRPGMPGGPDLNDILNRLDSALEGTAQKIVSRWNRTIRPEDPGFAQHGIHGRTSHDIEMLHQIIDNEQVHQDVGQTVDNKSRQVNFTCEASKNECQMTQHIISTGIAFQLFRHIYIKIKIQSGQQWNLKDANQFASQAVDKYLEKRGIKKFGGQIILGGDPLEKGTAAYAAAQKHKEQETSLRQQIGAKESDATKQEFEEQKNKALAILNVLQHPETINRLKRNSKSYDPKLRAFFEKMIKNKDVAWEFIEKMLKKIDG